MPKLFTPIVQDILTVSHLRDIIRHSFRVPRSEILTRLREIYCFIRLKRHVRLSARFVSRFNDTVIRSAALREYRERIDFCAEDRLPSVQINNTAFHRGISKAIRQSRRVDHNIKTHYEQRDNVRNRRREMSGVDYDRKSLELGERL